MGSEAGSLPGGERATGKKEKDGRSTFPHVCKLHPLRRGQSVPWNLTNRICPTAWRGAGSERGSELPLQANTGHEQVFPWKHSLLSSKVNAPKAFSD